MNDRGEKIINLAREMLRSDMVFEQPAPPPKVTISFKILCLVTVLTAVASSAVTEWSAENHRPLNHYEKTELNALIFYTARVKGIGEDILRREVIEKTGITDLDDMTAHEFLIARRLLQEKAQ